MREIKFRVWTGKKMVDGDTLKVPYKSNSLKPFFYDDWGMSMGGGNPPLREYKSAELMQFTGLQDKNGKDIYDGDIMQNDRLMFVVEWSDVGKWVGVALHEEALLYVYGCRYEVIANIHQNPELLIKCKSC